MDLEENDASDILFSKSFIGSLIMEVNSMLRNASIEADLSSVLDKYQNALRNSQILLSNGIVNINFAEAALFLQSTSALYGKKVDLLWATTLDCRKRMIEFEAECRKRKEAAAIEETRKINVKKIINEETNKKVQMLATETRRYGKFWEKVNLCMAAIQKKSKETDVVMNINHTRNHKWKQINQQRKQSSLNVDLRDYCISEPHFLIDQEIVCDDELLTKLNELSLCQLLNTMSSDEKHFKVKYLCQKLNQVSYFYENDLYLTQYLKLKKLKLRTLDESNYNEYNEFVLRCQQEKNSNRAERITEITRGKSRISDAVSFTDSAFQERSFFSDSYPASVSSRRKSDSLFGEGNIQEEDDDGNLLGDTILMDDIDEEHSYCISDRGAQDNIDEANNNVTDNTCCDSECLISELKNPDAVETLLCESTESTCQNENMIPTPEKDIERKRKNSLKHEEEKECKRSRKEKREEIEPNLRKRRRVNLSKLIKVIVTEKLGKFERFYFQNYKREDGESGIECDEFDYDDDDDDVEPFSFEEEINNSLDLDESAQIEVEENDSCNIAENASVDSVLSSNRENLNDNERTLDINIQANESSTNLISCLQNTNECSSSMKEKSHSDVLQWQIFMRDKLKKIEQKSDFDIHLYSTNIIESIPLNQTKKFTELLSNRSATETSKYFLATLSLACTNNIDVLGVEQGKVSNDTLELKLLSKTRHHEELEHYLPPSDKLREKMKKLQMVSVSVPSTSNVVALTQNKHKKLKLS